VTTPPTCCAPAIRSGRRYIAETFFDPGARQVNAERGMLGYTGTFEGEPISVQSTGMGCPSAGIVFEELIMLGATRLVRVGTCGGLGDGMAMGDTVVGVAASSDDSDPVPVRRDGGIRPERDVLVGRDRRPARRDGSAGAVHVGPVVTSGLFYDPDPTTFARWKRLGHIGVEMEAAMMYTIAAVKGVESLAIMTVSDLLGESGDTVRISDEELKAGVDQMMRISCAVAVS
jgi:purine-nucleoside phosphorylase